jgi:hypothetical protein
MENKTVDRLSDIFTVQDVMTKADQLKRADTLENAQYLFDEYDVVPYPREGEIRGFFRRGSSKINQIETSILVSHGTSVFDLPKLLRQNQFYFVISANRIVGYIHYSDLNKSIIKIPIFAVFQTAERGLWEQIMYRISEEDLLKVFEEHEVKRFVRKKEENEKRNVNIGWTGIFTFPYILKLARFYGLTHLADSEIKLLKETRNKIAHSDRNLVTEYDDVQRLVEACDLCQSLIKYA